MPRPVLSGRETRDAQLFRAQHSERIVRTRTLGKTGLEVGVIGLGTEYLVEVPRETVVSMVHEAIDRGVNYFDVLFAYEHYQSNFGAAFKTKRDQVLITGHLSSGETDGQYRRTRDVAECEELFHQLLTRLDVDYVDVVFLQNCDAEDDYKQVVGPGGILELAQRLQREGKARFIGLSGHRPPVSGKAVRSGSIDVLMHPINLQGDATPGRKELYQECAKRGVGLVGMKPFAGGGLLSGKDSRTLTPVQCLSYALSQPGVSTLVPGVKDLDELRATLAYLDSSDEEKDFSSVLPDFRAVEEGTCVYCNHCLPCPVGIDIGETIRLLDTARLSLTDALRSAYDALPTKPSQCIECGDCTPRCPFSVNIISRLHQASGFFGATRE